jgi:3-deoxy-D-manno-octulosonic-acid transferase
MIRPLYSLVMSGAQPFLRRKLRRRGVAEPGYLQHVDERFGIYPGRSEGGRIWIHAVSLGAPLPSCWSSCAPSNPACACC